MLHRTRVSAPGSTPSSRVFVLHGMFGRGRNWAGLANALVRARPDLEVSLVDLRLHGESRGFSPPHSVAACAQDVAALASADAEQGRPIASVVGHSFGGKVALAALAHPWPSLRCVVDLDANPFASARAGESWAMLDVLRVFPGPFATRDEGTRALESAGVTRPIAQWMAQNLDQDAAANPGSKPLFRWSFDLDAMTALITSYFTTDLAPFVEDPPESISIDVVRASRNSAIPDVAASRIESASKHGRAVTMETLDSGHWLNVDAPGAVVGKLASVLPR